MADGVLTPAVSVTSAAAGLAVAKPSIAENPNTIMGIALVRHLYIISPLLFTQGRDRLFSSPFSLCSHSAREGLVSRSRPVSVLNLPQASPLPWDLVTFVWLMLLGITGIINITSYPGIFRAFDPSRAVLCALRTCSRGRSINDSPVFVRTGNYDSLAGVLLAVTGCEAMFAKCVSWEIRICRVD